MVRGRDIDGIRTGRKRIGNLYQIPSGFFATVILLLKICTLSTEFIFAKYYPSSDNFINLSHNNVFIKFPGIAVTLINTGFFKCTIGFRNF